MAESKTLSEQFAEEIRRFATEIEGLATSFPTIMTVADIMHRKAHEDFGKFLEKNATLIKEDDQKKQFKMTGDSALNGARLERKFRSAERAFTLLHRSFLTSMVSQYDSFLGRLLRLIFLAKPEVLNASDKAMTFADLTKFDSIQEAREFTVEKEVESIIRKSHSDHFAWLERTLAVNLRVDLEVWPHFIELTERRNLFVHCDGVVSSQYIAVCQANKVNLEKEIVVGAQLDVTRDYLEGTARNVSEIGVKLGQVAWRKLLPDKLNEADNHLNSICYELLHRGDFELARRLLDFACMKAVKHSSEETRRFLILNRAQTYKWLKDEKTCREIIGSEDWSACSERFKISVAVLSDDFDSAAELMPSAEKDGVLLTGYKDWPIFKEFRKTPQFLSAYQQIYGKPFVIETTTSTTSNSAASN